MEPLKEMFNKKFYQQLAASIGSACKDFDEKNFVKDVTHDMEDLSLNQRMRNTSVVMQKHLPNDYKKSVNIMKKAVTKIPRGYVTLIFPDFIGLYGHDDKEFSLEALSYFTSFGSSEFAIREFLKRDPLGTLKVMETWAEDKSEHIRCLASEGSRPRLPWSFKLDAILKEPKLTRNILEKLKMDDSAYVKKSVANHLNDFSKDHTGYMLDIVSSWNKKDPNTAWIIKHACRTLIKKGNERALHLFDFKTKVDVDLSNFKISSDKISLGESLQFDFKLTSTGKKPQLLAVDYCIHYYKKTGPSPKVFKLKEVELKPGEAIHVIKKQLFQDLTTRKHYSGKHVLEIIVNGNILGKKEFMLEA